MATISLDVPEELYGALQQKAAAEHRTVEQETLHVLSEALRKPEIDNRERRRRLLEEIASRDLPDTSGLPDPVDLIREDRDR